MELPYRVVRLTVKLIWEDPDERCLAIEAANFFLERYLTDQAWAKVALLSDVVRLNMFRWGHYCVARDWIEGHRALAATLQLRRAFKPWEVRKS